jgi:cold shock CspA family protein
MKYDSLKHASNEVQQMQIQPEITYRNVRKTDDIETLIREKAAALDKVCDHIISLRVALERPHKQKRKGNPFRIRLDVTVPPGHEIVVKKVSGETDILPPLDAVIRKAFDVAKRQLRKTVQLQRNDVKTHPNQQVSAVVTELYPEDGNGMLRTTDGREIYFDNHVVVNGQFKKLRIGAGVRFEERQGEKGPLATTVQIVELPRHL